MNNLEQNSPQYHSMALVMTVVIHAAFIALIFFMAPQNESKSEVNTQKDLPRVAQSNLHPKA